MAVRKRISFRNVEDGTRSVQGSAPFRRMKSFFAELKRRNVYKVAVAYAVVGWLLMQVATQIFPFFDIPNWAVRLVVLLIIAGFPIALIIAWAFELTPEGLKLTEAGEQRSAARRGRVWIYVVIIAAAISLGLFFLGRSSIRNRVAAAKQLPAKSIAVLPFVDMSQAKDQEYFCDGISEEILDALAKVDGLRVVARTSSFSFKGKSADVGEVATKLNVANVLEGSLRRSGNHIRVTAQLIAHDGFHLWSETYDRELQDVFAMQDEITRSIVDALKIKLAVAPAVSATQNPESHDLYLQGLYFVNKSDEQSLRKALGLFQRALDKDPSSSRAWTGIARAWDFLADAYVKPLDAYPQVKAAAAMAVSLDERNAEAHCWLGDAIHVLDWDLAGNEREVKRALEIDPNSGLAHIFAGFLRSYRGDWQGAVVEGESAVKQDPLSPSGVSFLVLPYLRTGRLNEALAAAHRISELDTNYLYRDPPLGQIYFETGRYAEAVAEFTKAQEVTHLPSSGLAASYARLGRTEDARRALDQILEAARAHYVAAGGIAGIYAALGDKDEAFRWLERAYGEHDAGLCGLAFDPAFESLRVDPRFADLVRRVGLDPATVSAATNKK